MTTQNPPDFSWPYVPDASDYHLQLARTASMDGERVEMEGLKTNYFNFARTLNEGAWYWRVRYRFAAGGWSPWSTVRRFRIAEENVRPAGLARGSFVP